MPAVLLLVAVVVRLAFVAATPDYQPTHDDGQYDRLACAIAVSGTYPLSWPGSSPRSCGTGAGREREPSAFRPPGFPAFLAGVYTLSSPVTADRWTAGRIAQALVGALLAGLIGLLAARLWDRRVGLAALAVAALAPPLVVAGGSLLSDLLFTTLVVAGVLAVLTASRRPLLPLAVAGALLGLAALTRPQGLILLIPLAIGAWRGASLRGVAVLVAVALLTVAPWTLRNAVQLDAFVPVSTHIGESLAGTYNHEARTRLKYPGAWLPPGPVHEFADIYVPGSEEVWRQRQLQDRSVDFALQRPAYVAEVSARNSLRLGNLDGRAWWRGNARSMSLPPWAGDAAAYGFFALALLALAAVATGAARRAPVWLWLVPLLLVLTTVPIVGEIRMRTPMDPFLVLLAALALTHGAERLLRRRNPH